MPNGFRMLGMFTDCELLEEYSLSFLCRYNNRPRIKDESVAVHSFFVSLYCIKIIEELENCGLQLSFEQKYKIVSSAVIHDVGEVLTSDVPYDVKNMNKNVRVMLENTEEEYLNNKFAGVDMVSEFDKDEDDVLSYNVVKLADTYSVIQFCANEERLGNKSNDVFEIKCNATERAANYIDKINEVLRNKFKKGELKNA